VTKHYIGECSVLAFNVNCTSKDVQEEARINGVSTGP
jgi:hypothetical protein